MTSLIPSRPYHFTTDDVNQDQHYLMSILESLGLSTIRLNEFNNNEELRHLVHSIKQSESPSSSKNIITKNQGIEELRSLGINIKTERKSEIRGDQQELAEIVRIVKYSLYGVYKTVYGQSDKHDKRQIRCS